MGRGNLLKWSVTDRSKCFASKLMKTTWDHNSDTWKYCSVTLRCVCTVDNNYCRFGGTTCPIFHPKYGCRFLQKQFSCLHDASIQKTLTVTHSLQPKISHENITISFLRASSRRRYVKISTTQLRKHLYVLLPKLRESAPLRSLSGMKTSIVLKESAHTRTHARTHTHTVHWMKCTAFFFQEALFSS